ncbi:MAG: hypothetical protein ACRCWM_06595, partial [Sarcina sp.]
GGINMSASCPKCSRKLDFTYSKESIGREMVKCPKCKTNLEESKATKIISLLLAVVPIFFLAYFINNFFLRIIVIFIWAFAINLYIRPLIARFSLVKK